MCTVFSFEKFVIETLLYQLILRAILYVHKDSLKKTSRPAIVELSGTLFMLAVISDEDDAATLRADLKRSRIDEYKLQRCATANDARNMLRACAFDLLILQLDEFENPEAEVERFRAVGFEKPILGLMSRRRLQRSGFIRYEKEKGCRLNIEKQPFEVLLDRLPWSYKLIKYQFMKDVIHVEWRES